MSIKDRLMPYAASLLTSQRLNELREQSAMTINRLRGQGKVATFYCRVDDPYSWLLAQQLAALGEETGLEIRPRTLLYLPQDMYPEPDLHTLYAIQDARYLARLHGLTFTGRAPPPEALALAASAVLLACEQQPDFLSLFQTLCHHLWQGNLAAIMALGEQRGSLLTAEASQVLCARRDSFIGEGHYLTGTLHYGGTWYWGPDRLDYLRERLLHRQGGHVSESTDWRQFRLLPPPPHLQAKPLQFFFSFRSPYSYLAVSRVLLLAQHYGLDLHIRPVLPMVMRGLAVPAAKRFYILKDAAREARRLGIPFGHICDPVGAGVSRCMAVWPLAEKAGRLEAFVQQASTAIWSRGVCVASDAGLRSVVTAAGLDWAEVREVLADDSWIECARANRDEMMAAGSWGVPTFRLDGVTLWGQDRLPLLERLMLGEIDMRP